jgi:hypothetical protein
MERKNLTIEYFVPISKTAPAPRLALRADPHPQHETIRIILSHAKNRGIGWTRVCARPKIQNSRQNDKSPKTP